MERANTPAPEDTGSRPFVLDAGVRVSARNIICRELVSNLLIHREYTHPLIARLVIGNDGIHTENASRALFEGRVTLDDFNPMPKNPIIAGFFTQIGRADELGSGTRNLYKYSRLYSGREPVARHRMPGSPPARDASFSPAPAMVSPRSRGPRRKVPEL